MAEENWTFLRFPASVVEQVWRSPGVNALAGAGATGWTEDVSPLTSSASVALVRSLVGDYMLPRLAAGAVRPFTSESADGVTDSTGEWIDRLPPSRYVFPRHAHDSYEVCWVIDGRCVLWLAGRYVLLTPQRACVIQPGELHHLLPTSRLEPFRTLWCLATPRGVVLDEGTFAQGQRLTVGHFVALPSAATPYLADVASELRERRAQHDLFARLRLMEVAALVLRAVESPGPSASGAGSDPTGGSPAAFLVQRLMQHIQGHHGPAATLRSLAAYVGLSPNYATTMFRQTTGRTLMAYVNEIRHRHAAELLRETDLSVATVAQQAGYRDPYYFDRVFRQHEGCPPLTYRRLCRAALPARHLVDQD